MTRHNQSHTAEDSASDISDRSIPTSIRALAIASRRLGLHLDPQKLQRELQSISEEIGAADIVRCATSLGLRATGLRPGWNGIGRLEKALPAIVFLRDGEAMVLIEVKAIGSDLKLGLLDPDAGEGACLQLGREQFLRIWSGDLIVLRRDVTVRDERRVFDVRFVTDTLKAERGLIRDLAICATMLSLLALAPILFWRIMSDRVIQYKSLSTLSVVCTIMVIAVIFETVFSTVRRNLLLRVTTKADVKLTTEMFSRVLALPSDYFERTPTGLTMHKIGQIGRIRMFLVGQLFGTVLDAGILLFFVPIMFIFSPTLTMVVLLVAAMICGWIIFMLPRYRRASGAVETAEGYRGAFLAQSIQGIKTVKSLALESRQMAEWDAHTATVAHARFEEGRIANQIQFLVTPLERFMVSGSFGIGAYFALHSNDPSSVSVLFTFLMLSQRLGTPLIQASQLINQFDEARVAVAVIGSLVNQPPEEGRSGDGVRDEIQGHVEFSKVLFSYKGALRPALREVSFEIPQGTTLGVMGRSGSGKTTVTRLIQRLNSEYQGLIKIDGVDVRQYDLTHLRSSLGVVLQENFLFSGTIRSNITIAKPDATFEEMVHAARLAGAEEFIEKLPGGYETYIYEGSPNLSGGQRQRLAIARALITDPRILILDEATSALDAESEAIVNANIDRIAQGRTVITISHRLAALVKADAILVMEQGEVNDIGKHHELLERNEIYAHLWYTQNPHTAPGAGAGGPPPARPAPPAQIAYRGPAHAA